VHEPDWPKLRSNRPPILFSLAFVSIDCHLKFTMCFRRDCSWYGQWNRFCRLRRIAISTKYPGKKCSRNDLSLLVVLTLCQWFSTFFGPWTIFSKKVSDGPLCYADTSTPHEQLVETVLHIMELSVDQYKFQVDHRCFFCHFLFVHSSDKSYNIATVMEV